MIMKMKQKNCRNIYSKNNYSQQLQTLQTMGFTNNIQNIQILNMTNGDVNQAMAYLL